jgi:hypothetical protein
MAIPAERAPILPIARAITPLQNKAKEKISEKNELKGCREKRADGTG